MSSVAAPAGGDPTALSQPRQLIVTIYGLHAREENDWLPIASLVRLMSDLGVDGQSVRSSISRLKRRGTLRSLRRGSVAGYALSPAMHEVLRLGDRRIFDLRPARLSDGWVQVIFTVPEAERGRRHELRSRLAGLGFGALAPGVWVAPGKLADEVQGMLARQQLSGYVDIFRGDHLGFTPVAELVPEWWDLDDLAARYAGFVAKYRPLARRVTNRAPEGAAAFADYVRMLTVWRRLRYRDPGLPVEVLPARWVGTMAATVFAGINDVLRPLAHRHATRLLHD